MTENWAMVVDFAWLSLFIIMAAWLKSCVRLLRAWIVPTAIIAGFLGLVAGPEVLGLVPFDPNTLGTIVYHFMAIGFIALSLKERDQRKHSQMLNSGMFIVSTYLVQGLVGLVLMLLLVQLLYPNMFPGIGLLLPLGYGQGPGQAYSIGSQWEELGISGGGNLGLTIAAMGFLWASLIGVPLMNIWMRMKRFASVHTDAAEPQTKLYEESEPKEIPLGDALDKLSFQVALIGVIYLITYATIAGLAALLEPLGTFGDTLAQLLWGFHFLLGSLIALAFRWGFNRRKNIGRAVEHRPNNYLLQRIAGFSFDYMIAASIAAISIYALQEYGSVVMLLTTLGGFVTIGYVLWLSPRLFPKDPLPNAVGFYGMLTGTISTGMALVKAVDPHFRTNVTDNMVLGSATAIMFGFPLLLILNMPIIGYVDNRPMMYGLTLLALLLFFALLLGAILWRTRVSKR